MTRNLVLTQYHAQYPARFSAEAKRLKAALGSSVQSVEHVGSTAVPGLAGKPVLDIAIAVGNVEAADACIAPIEHLGYQYRGQHGDDPRRRYYVMNVESQRVAQLHLYILPAKAWNEMLILRDALRTNATLATAYAAEKLRVAEAVAWDKSKYSIEKGTFIRDALAQLAAMTSIQ